MPESTTSPHSIQRDVADPLYRMNPNTERLLPSYAEAFGDADDAVLRLVSDLYLVRKTGTILRVQTAMATKPTDLAQYGKAYAQGRTDVPAIAVMRTEQEYADDRYNPPWIAFKTDYPYPDRRDVVVKTPKEIPWNVQYTLSIWTKNQEDMNYMLHEMYRKFHRMAQIVIRNQRVDVKWVGSVDNSDLEPAEGESKTIRTDVMILVETGIECDSIMTPTASVISLDLSTVQTFNPNQFDKIEGIVADEDGITATNYQ